MMKVSVGVTGSAPGRVTAQDDWPGGHHGPPPPLHDDDDDDEDAWWS